MPAALLSANLTDQELAHRQQARTAARRTLPDPATIVFRLASPSSTPATSSGMVRSADHR
jgi:hypothetical protein